MNFLQEEANFIEQLIQKDKEIEELKRQIRILKQQKDECVTFLEIEQDNVKVLKRKVLNLQHKINKKIKIILIIYFYLLIFHY